MSPNTGGNTANENVESNENIKTDNGKRLDIFAKQFANNKLENTSKTDIFSEIKKYFDNDSFSTEQEREILKFAGETEGFSDLKISDLNFYHIRKNFVSEYSDYISGFDTIKNRILKIYNISSDQYSQYNIQSLLEGKTKQELARLLKKPANLQQFIYSFNETIDGEIKKKNSKSILPENFSESLRSKVDNLSEDKKQELKNIVTYFDNSNIRESSFANNFSQKVSYLYESGILTDTEIEELVCTFVPSITIQTLESFVSSEQKSLLMDKLFEKVIGESTVSLNDDEKNEIYKSLKSVLIDTKDLLIAEIIDVKNIIEKSNLIEKAGKEIQDTLVNLENQEGINDLIGFQEKIEKSNLPCYGFSNIEKGSILEYEVKLESGKIVKHYYEVHNDIEKSQDGSVYLLKRGQNVLEKESGGDHSSFSRLYEGFEKLDKAKSLKAVYVYDQKELDAKIDAGDIIESNEQSEFYDEADISKRSNEEIEAIDVNLSDEEKEQKIEEIEKKYSKFNLRVLKSKINNLDQNGQKYGLDIGTTVKYKIEGKEEIFTITGTDSQTIEITYANGEKQKLLCQEFYQGFLGNPTPERIGKVEDLSVFEQKCKDNDSGNWKKLKIENGKLLDKSVDKEGNNHYTEYSLLVGEKDFSGIEGCNIIKIHNIGNNTATVSYGSADYEKLGSNEKREFDKEKKKKLYSVDPNKYEIPLGLLSSFIEESGVIPRNLEKENEQPATPKGVDLKSGFWSKYMQSASIADLIGAGKLVLDSIENKLKEGSDEIAAQWANKIPLPEDLKADMQTRIEQAQKKRGDEFFDRLKVVDSKVAIKMVRSTIEDKNSPESKREACLLFMAKSYGHLYTKGPLFCDQGKFLWYKSFGGTIGDEYYRKVEAECKKEDINFSEHDLMIKLLGEQCRGNPPPPRRRSKLHKEYKAMMNGGKEDEMKKGEDDAKDKRTFTGRLEGVALDEMSSGGINNTIGSLTELIGKGDDGRMDRLEMVPFIMMTSGIAFDLDGGHQQKIRGALGNGVPMMSLGHMSSNSGIHCYNNAVLEISRILESDNPNDSNFKGMYQDALKLINNAKNPNIEPRDRYEHAKDFYEKHADILSRTLLMTASRRTDKYAKYENLIRLAYLNDNNSILKEYYERYSGTADAFLNMKETDGFADDAYQSKSGEGFGGLSGMAPEEVFKTYFQGRPGQIYTLKSGEMFQKEFIEQLKSYRDIDYDSVADKRKAMRFYIRAFIYGYLLNHSQSIERSIDLYPGLVFLGLNKNSFDNVTYGDFKSSNDKPNAASEELLEQCIDRVLNDEGGKEDIKELDLNNIDNYVEGIKGQTKTVIDKDKKSANEDEFDEYSQAA